MSRSGYSDDGDYNNTIGLYRHAVDRAIAGKRGQAFMRELAAALDAMPVKELIAEELAEAGHVCAIGAVGLARGIDMSALDPEDPEGVGVTFGISETMAREIVFVNDENGPWRETPANRWKRMRAWVDAQVRSPSEGDDRG